MKKLLSFLLISAFSSISYANQCPSANNLRVVYNKSGNLSVQNVPEGYLLKTVSEHFRDLRTSEVFFSDVTIISTPESVDYPQRFGSFENIQSVQSLECIYKAADVRQEGTVILEKVNSTNSRFDLGEQWEHDGRLFYCSYDGNGDCSFTEKA